MISRIFTGLLIIALFASCSTSRRLGTGSSESVKATIDLINVQDDKVKVTVTPPPLGKTAAIYRIPRIIPGTYAIEDYGRFIEDLKAFDKKGNELPVTRQDVNTWVIAEGGKVVRVTYWVNDTIDSETDPAKPDGPVIFSPAGTNILAGKNFILNMGGFIGYFTGHSDRQYEIAIDHPGTLWAGTALVDKDNSDTRDVFNISRYANVVDNPIMYATPDYETFQVGDIEIILSIYSPRNKSISAKAFAPDLERMMKAQKNFLGDINSTEKYAVLAYISDASPTDAQGFGALEHNASTVAVFGENMTSKDLIHVISHEFFHILTPLTVHSKEIQNFQFNEPDMSQHLWMYEGITEYFANLFQVNQGLIGEEEFFKLMAKKIDNSKKYYEDDVSFTVMSKNVLDSVYHAQYGNVYEKGALLAMCMDIIIRDNSNGERGILDMMRDLSKIYGANKPFDDAELIPKVADLTYPEIRSFIRAHIVEGVPVDYDEYLSRVGVTIEEVSLPEENIFVMGQNAYLRVDPATARVIAFNPDESNQLMNALGVRHGDELLTMNGQKFDGTSIMSILMMGMNMEEGQPVTMTVKRGGEVIKLQGKAKLNQRLGPGLKFEDQSKRALKEAWLKG